MNPSDLNSNLFTGQTPDEILSANTIFNSCQVSSNQCNTSISSGDILNGTLTIDSSSPTSIYLNKTGTSVPITWTTATLEYRDSYSEALERVDALEQKLTKMDALLDIIIDIMKGKDERLKALSDELVKKVLTELL